MTLCALKHEVLVGVADLAPSGPSAYPAGTLSRKDFRNPETSIAESAMENREHSGKRARSR
ncbi:hypothetical protein GCM10017566_58530 [Amycolatopsis bartoniae]|uniref:Uncharacterized protein n=1 Tax=Amycolatopsis bartoniae TaxID=941986 RepID=A0A8H9IZX0_9PSEU|nr:hypothetical protein GCM10017566_58530 [Amycolatopsis bartoniae]